MATRRRQRSRISPRRCGEISPNGDGDDDDVSISYGLSKPSTATVYVTDSENRRYLIEAPKKQNAVLVSHLWDGTIGGKVLRDGKYAFHVDAEDAAGNFTTATLPLTIANAGTPRLEIVDARFSPDRSRAGRQAHRANPRQEQRRHPRQDDGAAARNRILDPAELHELPRPEGPEQGALLRAARALARRGPVDERPTALSGSMGPLRRRQARARAWRGGHGRRHDHRAGEQHPRAALLGVDRAGGRRATRAARSDRRVSPSASDVSWRRSGVTPDLSIIVVSYNTRDLLCRCLESVAASLALTPALRAETIVVDNASTDGSAQTAASWFPWARVIARDSNAGFAAANNEGIVASSGRIVLLLNSDTEVLGGALAEIVDCFERHPDAGIVGGHLLDPDGSEQESVLPLPGLSSSSSTSSRSTTDSRPRASTAATRPALAGEEHEVDHPLGACFAISREVIEAIGPMDARFFMYCEEIDWALRARKAGWQAWYAPRAQVIHYGGASSRQVRGRMLVELYRSRYRYWRKHRGLLFVWAARRIVHLGLAAQSARWREAHRRGDLDADLLAELASRRPRDLDAVIRRAAWRL